MQGWIVLLIVIAASMFVARRFPGFLSFIG